MTRSWLFFPADNERYADEALSGDADAVILDLEDAVAEGSKATARANAARYTHDPGYVSRGLYVRINALDTPHALVDVSAVVGPALAGIVLPKVSRAADVAIVDWLLAQSERAAGLPPGAISIVPLVESAGAVVRLGEIAHAGPRVYAMAYGSGDLAADTGMKWHVTGRGDIGVRSALVVHSRDAGLAPPIDSVAMAIDDTDGLRCEAERARDMGFQGKLCVHPSQVPVINTVFVPDAERVDWAHRVLAATREADERGAGAIRLDGELVDIATIRTARQVLALAEGPPVAD